MLFSEYSTKLQIILGDFLKVDLPYFDVCVVYMTSELQNKFMAIVSNEDHMWNSMEAFLDSQIDLKKFKRVFLLDHDKLILTRRSVANTITLKVISSGNKPDECIDLTDEQKEIFLTNSDFEDMVARLSAWATANGEVFENGQFTPASPLGQNVAAQPGPVILIVMGTVAVISFGLVILLKARKKEN